MSTRFNLPYIFETVARQRLFKLLDDNLYKQNILITGQAAQGKSTLVASYLQRPEKGKPDNKKSDHHILWLSLCEEESHHIKLFDKLLNGIRQITQNMGNTDITQVSGMTLGTEKGFLRHVELLAGFFNEISFPLTIVFDDLQSIDESSSGFQLINALIDIRFKKLTFFLLSRSIPAMEITRLKIARNIFMLGNNDLAFSIEETRTFFSKKIPNGKLNINERPNINTKLDHDENLDIEKIHQATGGWAGGLTLISESIRQFKDMPKLPARLSTELFSFFSQEIYNTLPDVIQQFLMKTSILDTIDLRVVDHLQDSEDGVQILAELEKRNLFIQRMDSNTEQPLYKYHDLFKDFLIQDLLKVKGWEYFIHLNEKAGSYFWQNKDHEQALKYFSRAKSFENIVKIIKIKGTDFIIQGKISGLEIWINNIPEEIVQNDPWLLFFQTMARRIKGGKKNIKALRHSLSMFEQTRDVKGLLLSTGYLIEASVFIRLPSLRVLEWIKKGESLLEEISGTLHYPWAKALLWQQIGLGYIAGDGNIPKGVSACRNAIMLGKQIHNQDVVLDASITMTFGYVQAGDFAHARQMLLKIQEMTKEGRHPEYRALKSIVDIDLALKNGQLDKAQKLLNQSENDIEKFGLIFLYPGFIEVRALYLVYSKRYDEAGQMADHLSDFSILEGNIFYKGICHRIKALCRLKQGKYLEASKEIKKALKLLAQAKKGDIHHYLARQMEGVIFFRRGMGKSARKKLASANEYFRQISSDLSFSETSLFLGLAAWESEDQKSAAQYLKQGFDKASQGQYEFLPLVDDELLIKAIVLITALGEAKSFEPYLFSLISRCDSSLVFSQIEKITGSYKKNLTVKLVDNLRLLYKTLIPQVRINTLGNFNIFCDNILLDKTAFEGTRPILLLKAIILHGSSQVPKEILIDNLWPDASAKAGEKNFKINLHRLRKALEPKASKKFGYMYVIQKAGLISLDSDLVRLDINEFMKLAAKADNLYKSNQYEKAIGCYEKASRIYGGDYFVEEPYMEWISRKRDLFRSRYLEILKTKAMIHEELGQIEKAIEAWTLILEADPYFETAYQNLMILYADSGQKNRALKLYQDCKQIFNDNLGTDLQEETHQIFMKIEAKK